jgi:hypothetical protein
MSLGQCWLTLRHKPGGMAAETHQAANTRMVGRFAPSGEGTDSERRTARHLGLTIAEAGVIVWSCVLTVSTSAGQEVRDMLLTCAPVLACGCHDDQRRPYSRHWQVGGRACEPDSHVASTDDLQKSAAATLWSCNAYSTHMCAGLCFVHTVQTYRHGAAAVRP